MLAYLCAIRFFPLEQLSGWTEVLEGHFVEGVVNDLLFRGQLVPRFGWKSWHPSEAYSCNEEKTVTKRGFEGTFAVSRGVATFKVRLSSFILLTLNH